VGRVGGLGGSGWEGTGGASEGSRKGLSADVYTDGVYMAEGGCEASAIDALCDRLCGSRSHSGVPLPSYSPS